MNKFKSLLIFVVAIFIGVIGTLYVNDNYLNKEKVITKSTVELTEQDSLKTSINKIYNSVVVIETYNSRNQKSGTGTGFIYKKDEKYGYVITNHHVIDGSIKIKVTNMEDQETEAEVIGSDEYSDIALLKIPVSSVLLVAELGSTDGTEVGDTVFTVGSPLGIKYKGTVTKGILSGKDRKVTVELSNGSFIMDVLQTDAAINPGNSGGPLLNINGQVIGVTSLKLVEDEIEGMGFALPIEIVKSSVEKLESGDEITRPILGVQLMDVSNAIYLKKYDIDSSIKEGTVIIKVEEDSAAQMAGLEVGDVIISLNDEKTIDTAHFRYSLYKYNVGDIIKIKYNRNGKEKTIKVKLTNKL